MRCKQENTPTEWHTFDWDYEKKKYVCCYCKKEIDEADVDKKEYLLDAFL